MTTYNGYKNYETWNVALHIDNSEGDSNYWRSEAEGVYRDATASEHSTRKEEAVSDLADRLKESHEEAMPELSGTFADLLSAALSEVDWHEIAEGMISEVAEDIDAEDEDTAEDEASEEIEEGDITTHDGRVFHQHGKPWLEADEDATSEEISALIRAKMDAEGFYPNLWMISDHGNIIPFTLD